MATLRFPSMGTPVFTGFRLDFFPLKRWVPALLFVVSFIVLISQGNLIMRKDQQTADLFPPTLPVAVIDYRETVSSICSQALSAFEGDRYEASMQMSRLTARPVSKCMLDGYTSPARDEFNLPFYLAPALELVTGTRLLSTWLMASVGGQAVFGPDVIDSEIGRVERKRDELNRQISQLKKARGLK